MQVTLIDNKYAFKKIVLYCVYALKSLLGSEVSEFLVLVWLVIKDKK